MKVIGVKHFSFNRKSDNKFLEGYEVLATFEDKYWDGVAGEHFTLWSDQVDRVGAPPAVGDEIQLTYNKYGKVTGYVIV